MDRRRLSNELLEAARHYAAKGWPVIPLHGIREDGGCTCRGGDTCSSPGKHPRNTHGLTDATIDPEIIQAWWGWWPDSNVGLATGTVADVLDVDGKAGFESLCQLEAEGKALPEGSRVVTGGGGWHIFFKPTAAGNRAAMMPGLDWRGKGGYIVAPPSLHVSGKRYKRDIAAGSTDEIPEAPAWLLELVKPSTAAQRPQEASEWLQGAVSTSYGQRALEAELAALALAPEGKRNHQLNASAFSLFQLVKAGALDSDETWSNLSDVGYRVGLSAKEVGRTLQSAWKSAEPRVLAEPEKPAKAIEIAKKPGRRVKLTPLADMPMAVVHWLWDDRIPMGSLTLIGGREGIGKSMLGYDLASDVTRGTARGIYKGKPKSVLISATEDSFNHTIVPRLRAAKADMSRIYRVDVEADDYDLELSLPRDVEGLTVAIKDVDAALLLMDPLLSRLDGKLDSHKDAEVRLALEPITKLAAETNCVVIGLIHVNKSSSTDPLTMLMGSRAFAAVARAVLFVMVDPEQDGLRLMAQAKNNLGRMDIPAMKFAIEDTYAGTTESGEEVRTGKLVWKGESAMDVHAAIALASRSQEDKTVSGECAEWLLMYLEDHGGIEESRAIKTEAQKAGYTVANLRTAREKLRLNVENLGMPRITTWKLPRAIEPAEAA